MIGASEQKLRQSKVAYSDAQKSAPAVSLSKVSNDHLSAEAIQDHHGAGLKNNL
jgi:hypothetical protein